MSPPPLQEPDPTRTVDPSLHADLLSALHQAAEDAETGGNLFVQILAKEIEPAIKDLSNCLLFSTHSRTELEESISKFELPSNACATPSKACTAGWAAPQPGRGFPTH